MFDCLILVSSSTEDIVREVTSAWGTARANCVIVVSGQKEDISQKLKNSGWLTVILSQFLVSVDCKVDEI